MIDIMIRGKLIRGWLIRGKDESGLGDRISTVMFKKSELIDRFEATRDCKKHVVELSINKK